MKKKLFLAISFTKRQKVEKAITTFFENKGFEVITGRKIRSGKNADDELKRIIKECDFGIVVYNELRHNISYEWGLLDALIGEKGHVFLFKDENIHINIASEISNKQGTTFTPFYGEDDEEEIIKSLEKDESLMDMIEDCIGRSISEDQSNDVLEAAKAIASSNLPLKLVVDENNEIDSTNPDLQNLKSKIDKIDNLSIEGHFYKSVTHFHMNELDQAELEMRKVIDLDSNNVAAHENLGVILSKLGKDTEAVDHFKIALSLDQDSYNTHTNLGISLTKLKKYAEAKDILENAIRLEPDKALAYSILGGALINLEEFDEAEKVLLKSINLDSKLSMAYGILGTLYIRQKRYYEAENNLKKELKLEPHDVSTRTILGRLYIDLKQYENAKKELDLSIELDPENADANANYALLLSRLDNKESDAESKFEEAIKLDKENIFIKCDFGEFLIKQKRYEEAKEQFTKSIELDDKYFLAHERLGFILSVTGHEEEAKIEYQIALDLNENNKYALCGLAFVSTKLGDYDDAKEKYELSLEQNPEDPFILQNLAELYIISGEYQKSLETAEKGFKSSENVKDQIIFKFFIFISQVLSNQDPDESQFISFLEENKGYDISFEFETLTSSIALKTKYQDQIQNAIDNVKKFSEARNNILKTQI